MRNILLTTILICLSFASSAKELTEKDSKSLCNNAMSLFNKNKIKEAYELFLPYWPLPESEITALINQTKSQWGTVQSRFGENAGFEFIETQRVGKSFIRHLYIQKFMNHSIRWQFTFYKPKNKWRVNGLVFDDQVGELFK